MAHFNGFENLKQKDEMTSIIEKALSKLSAAEDIRDDKKEKIKKLLLDQEFQAKRKEWIKDSISRGITDDNGLTLDEQIEKQHALWAKNILSVAQEMVEKK